MLVTIIYNTNFKSNADSLRNDIKQEWADCNVNKLGVTESLIGAKYQVQFELELGRKCPISSSGKV